MELIINEMFFQEIPAAGSPSKPAPLEEDLSTKPTAPVEEKKTPEESVSSNEEKKPASADNEAISESDKPHVQENDKIAGEPASTQPADTSEEKSKEITPVAPGSTSIEQSTPAQQNIFQ